jgi:Tol biopolymer transport system component
MKAESAPQEFFVAGGTLWREAPSYIVRPADEELFRLTLGGEYCNVLAARQMGKSSLMVRTANRLVAAGVRTTILDISTLGGGISTPEAWFFGFLDELAFQLGLSEDVNAWWEAHPSHNAVQLFSNFLRDVVLVEIQAPIVIFVDEIDSALGMTFTDDFFAAIRAAYNARASQVEFQRLTFVLLGVARPADLIRDRNRTPYNIGAHIHLSDFTLSELHPFQTVFEAVYPGQGEQIVAWVLDWTDGQPYLTQKLCAELIQAAEKPCSQESVAETVRRLFFTEEARKESNLRAIRDRIESSPNKARMLHIYGQILDGKAIPDDERSPAKNELKLTGLVRPSSRGQLEVRNCIYHTVFNQDWVRKSLPRSRTPQVAMLASLFAILAFIIAGYALYRQRIQPALTFAEQFQSSNSPEVKITSLARLLELDTRSQSEALELYSGLSQAEKLSLFGGLSNPQNVAAELVTVIDAFYQENPHNPAGNANLNAMKTVLGQIGAAGAPGLKTEIEFWLKGRQEADQNQSDRTAVSLYDSAWQESVARGHPNQAVRYDRALALIALEDYTSAYNDLQSVWEASPDRQKEITAVIQAHPALAAYIYGNPKAEPAILAFITPVVPTSTPQPTPTTQPSAMPPSPTATPNVGDFEGVYPVDGHTLLLLHLDGSYEGVQGEVGTATDTDFTSGRYDQGVLVDGTDTLTYTATENLNTDQGAVEFWLRPNWEGDAGGNYTLFWWGDEGSDYFHLRKDDINNLVFDYYYAEGSCGAPVNVAAWRAGEWHHLAFTWHGTEIRLYVDGQEVAREMCSGNAQPRARHFYIGSGIDGRLTVDAVIDELRISDVPRVGIPESVATPTHTATPEQPSPYAGWIAYGSGTGTGSEIILLNPATGFQQPITNNGFTDEGPSFSPDNWKVVYASNRSQSGWELYAFNLRSGIELQLTSLEGQARFPNWSPVPGDTRVVFERRTTEPQLATNIWMLDTASGDVQQLTHGGADSRPKWSPDGKRILFGRATQDTTGDGRITPSDASDLYTLDLASRLEKNLTRTPGFDDFDFTWSPDGKQIAFTSVRGDVNGDGAVNLSDSQDLFRIDADGSDEHRLDLGGKPVYTPAWSPDGRFILMVVVEEAGQTALWRFDTTNGKFTRLTEPGVYYHPAYSNLP